MLQFAGSKSSNAGYVWFGPSEHGYAPTFCLSTVVRTAGSGVVLPELSWLFQQPCCLLIQLISSLVCRLRHVFIRFPKLLLVLT
jgi:hypothetical protein